MKLMHGVGIVQHIIERRVESIWYIGRPFTTSLKKSKRQPTELMD